MPIIHSLLDTDLYKFTMWQAMLHRHPQTQAEYRFACRNATAFPLAGLVPAALAKRNSVAGGEAGAIRAQPVASVTQCRGRCQMEERVALYRGWAVESALYYPTF